MSYKIDVQTNSQEQIGWVAMRRKYSELHPEKKAAKATEVLEDNNVMPDDKAIAFAAKKALRKNIDICVKDVRVKVKEGWLTLYGEQNWNYQRDSAKNCLHIKGIKGIINNIT